MRVRDIVARLEAAGWEAVARTDKNVEFRSPGSPPFSITLPANPDAPLFGGVLGAIDRRLNAEREAQRREG